MSTELIEREGSPHVPGPELVDGVEVQVLDEVGRKVLTFRGRDQHHVDALVQQWSDTDEKTWLSRRPAGLGDGSTLDDLDAALSGVGG